MAADDVQLTITVPASLAGVGAADRARVLLALDAVRAERLTYRQAALALEISADRFLDLARDHGVSVLRYEAKDLAEDLSTLSKLGDRRTDE